MAVVALSALVVLAALPVQVEATDCPNAGEIERALSARLAARAEGTPPDRARLWRQDGLVHLELVNADGAVIAERTLVPRATCAETAELAAVVLASWESDVHPAFVGAPAEVSPRRGLAEPVSAPARPASFDLAAGVGLGWASGSAAVASLAATWVGRGEGIGARLWGSLDGARTLTLEPGSARWGRASAGAALAWRRGSGRIALDAFAGAGIGRLSATGSGFGTDKSAVSFSPVASAGGRVALWSTAHVAAWLGVETAWWLRRQTVYRSPDGLARDVPSFEVAALLGLAVGRPTSPR